MNIYIKNVCALFHYIIKSNFYGNYAINKLNLILIGKS